MRNAGLHGSYSNIVPNSCTLFLLVLISLGTGPGSLLRRPSVVTPQEPDSDGYYNYREGDTFEHADWRCFCTVNGDVLWSS